MAQIPTIIDNRNGNDLLDILKRLLIQTHKLDVATGTFEISSLLELDQVWQKLGSLRILMGDETTSRTKSELVQALKDVSIESIEAAKERDDTLSGLKAVRESLTTGHIKARVYTKAKFHPKCYLMDSIEPLPVDFAVVGSSNFTASGMTRNLELNLFTTDQMHIQSLRQWYEEVWKEGEDVKSALLEVIDPHLREYDPFTVYSRSLYEYFAEREICESSWETHESVIYSKLSKYQKDGYRRAVQIANEWNGCLICDGVGLGKTFIGLMILERCIMERKRVLMIVPKSAKESVWMSNIKRYLEPKYRRFFKELFDIRLHTDFGRDGTVSKEDLDYYRDHKQVIIIDEAHHFRNPRANRGRLLMRMAKNKQLYMLTATPINNSLDDLYSLINYFAQDDPEHFMRLCITHLRKYFISNEKRLESQHKGMDTPDAADTEDFLRTDHLLREILIQRSRKYVKESETQGSSIPLFPERQLPRVIEYSLKNVYSTIYGELKEAFDKDNPFLSLALYNTASFARVPDEKIQQTQTQVIGLIRTLLLKRLESSYKAFEASVEDLLAKMARFTKTHASEAYEMWEATNKRWWSIVQQHIQERLEKEEREAEEEDAIPDLIPGFKPSEYDMDRLTKALIEDMEILTAFLSKIYRRFYVAGSEGDEDDPQKDEKLQKLLQKLQNDPLLHGRKVLIFTEFRSTARYLHKHLQKANISHVEQVDSGRNVKNREEIIQRFAPYYNCFQNNGHLQSALEHPIDILISTDVLSEGLNLQDASLIINYDLHWNPVRLMQRIGRVDRRLNPEIEKALNRPADLQNKVFFWNFLPPNELDDLLHLKQRLDGKILRINRTLGIEGALLTPDDPEGSLILFNEKYEGTETVEELMRLEKENIEREHPALWSALANMPRRLFSGKAAGDGFHPILNSDGQAVADLTPNSHKGVFLCYRMPPVVAHAPKDLFDVILEEYDPTIHSKGPVRWYFYDYATKKISEDLKDIWINIRCNDLTPRKVDRDKGGLVDVLLAVKRHIKATYLRDSQTPVGAAPTLIAWMEIC